MSIGKSRINVFFLKYPSRLRPGMFLGDWWGGDLTPVAAGAGECRKFRKNKKKKIIYAYLSVLNIKISVKCKKAIDIYVYLPYNNREHKGGTP